MALGSIVVVLLRLLSSLVILADAEVDNAREYALTDYAARAVRGPS